jgi:hypothetical protein
MQPPRFPFTFSILPEMRSLPRPWRRRPSHFPLRNHNIAAARWPPLTGRTPHPPDSRSNAASPHLHRRCHRDRPAAGRPGRRSSGGTAPAGTRRMIHQPQASLPYACPLPSSPSAPRRETLAGAKQQREGIASLPSDRSSAA